MGRYYHLSKKITEEESNKILSEMKDLDDVDQVEMTQDHAYLKVITKDNDFVVAMREAVNICSRISKGLELSFSKFAV